MSYYRQRRSRFVLCVGLLTILAALWVLPGWQGAFAQAAGGAADAATRPDDSLFWHIIKSAGPIFGPLLGFLSVALVALIVLLSMDLRMQNAIPPGFVEGFTDTVNKRKFKEAFDMARADP